eukprot:COSAG01_NODE_15759_length_1302_cov_5.370740_3_plen_53_part_01
MSAPSLIEHLGMCVKSLSVTDDQRMVLIISEMHSETRASECCFGLLSAPPATP